LVSATINVETSLTILLLTTHNGSAVIQLIFLEQKYIIPVVSISTFQFFFLFFWRQGLSSPGWPGTSYVAQADLELLILLPLSPKCWLQVGATPSFYFNLTKEIILQMMG
jgi:hypothetical protein